MKTAVNSAWREMWVNVQSGT